MDRAAWSCAVNHLHAYSFDRFWLALPVFMLLWPAALSAAPPRVRFDVPHLVVCWDLGGGVPAKQTGDRLLEAELELSTLLTAGSEDDLVQYVYRITSPHRSLQVVDYLPKTTLASDYAGNIGIEQKKESTKSAGLAVTGAWDYLVKATGSGEVGSKKSAAVRYELVAPMEPVAAAGTIHRGHGAYFKLKPSRQTSLEGARVFKLVFRAPTNWRGDYLQIQCVADGLRRGVVRQLDEPVICGRRDFFVAVYLSGDQTARAAAQRLIRSEGVLQKLLLTHRHQLSVSSRRGAWRSLTSVFESDSSATAEQSLRQVLYTHHDRALNAIPNSLPKPLRAALARYLMARSALRSLNGI